MTEDKKDKKIKGVSDAERQEFASDTPAKPAGRTLKVRRIGNSLGVVLPKDVLAKLRVGEGDALSVFEAGQGILLTPEDESAELLRLADEIMERRRKVLRALAQ